MKVIGEAERDYICTVSHAEIEKFLGLYYNKKTRLKVGEEVDLGAGYEWSRKISVALETTEKFVEGNQPIIASLMDGYSVLVNIAKQGQIGGNNDRTE